MEQVQTLPEVAQNQGIARRSVITQALAKNEGLDITYNGKKCETLEEKIEAMRSHYKLSVLKKYGISLRDADGKPLKNVLIVNDTLVTVKLPALLVDETDGSALENLQEYYERTRLKASGAYKLFMKGIEKIDYFKELQNP